MKQLIRKILITIVNEPSLIIIGLWAWFTISEWSKHGN